MKEFAVSILKLLGAIVGSIVIIPVGLCYNIGHMFYLTFAKGDFKVFFRLLWRNIDGIFASIGHILGEGIAYGLDLLWNVNGECFEDLLTTEEKTHFGKKNITVSASTGELSVNNKMIKERKWFLKFLNFLFQQKSHADDAWKYTKARKEIKNKLFK